MGVLLRREVEVYVSTVTTGFTTSNSAKFLILEDFTLTTESTSKKVDYTKRIDIPSPNMVDKKVVTEIKAVKFNFTTYAKPVMNGGNHSSVEKLLLDSLSGSASTEGASDFTVNLVSTYNLSDLYFWIKFGDTIYRLNNTVAVAATYQFNIDSILTIKWETIGLSYQTDTSTPSTYTDHTTADTYIKNKLTYSSLQQYPSGTTYNIPITSGSLVIRNNVKELISPRVGTAITNPLSLPVTGRQISGKLQAYLKTGTANTAELLNDIWQSSALLNTGYILTLSVGGTTAPYVSIIINKCTIELPKFLVQDALSIDINFESLEITQGNNDDVTLKYKVQ